MDYRTSTVMLTFTPSNQTRCTTIQIISDEIIEESEQFSVILTNISPQGIIEEDTACITIIDEPIVNRTFIIYNWVLIIA